MKLPNIDNIQRSTAGAFETAQAPTVELRGDASGQIALGQAVKGIGDGLHALGVKRRERLQTTEYTRAKTRFEIDKVILDTTFDQRRDIENDWDTEYQTKLGELRDKYSEQISSELLRENFVLDTEKSIITGRAQLAQKAFVIESGVAVADAAISLDEITDKLTLPGQSEAVTARLRVAGYDEINTLHENNHIDDKERQKMLADFDNKYAVNRLAGIEDPRARLIAVKEAEWAEYLTADQRNGVIEAASKEVAIVEEQEKVESMVEESLATGQPEKEQLKRVRAMKDVDIRVREKVIAQIKTRFNEKASVKANTKNAAADKAFDLVTGAGGRPPMDPSKLPPHILRELEGKEYTKLERIYEQNLPSTAEQTANMVDFKRAYNANPAQALKDFAPTMVDMELNFKEGDIETVMELKNAYEQGQAPREVDDGLITTAQRNGAFAAGIDPDTDKKAFGTYVMQFETAIEQLLKPGQKKPTTAQIMQVTRQLNADVRMDVFWGSYAEIPVVEAVQKLKDKPKDAKLINKEISKAHKDKIIKYLEQKNLAVSDINIATRFLNDIAKGRVTNPYPEDNAPQVKGGR